jgi:hypothetical protein
MQELTIELNNYKSGGKDSVDTKQSDPFYQYADGEIRHRYNVNADGDIYFINGGYVNYLQSVIREYAMDARRMAQGFKKKKVLEDIWKFHNYDKVFEIIEKHFEIA